MSAVLERPTAQLSFFPSEPAPVVGRTAHEASTAFDVALEQLAMRTYWELPHKHRPPYYRGFVAGFIGQPLPKEALDDMAVFDGYGLAERLISRWNGRDRFI